ncbi:hypothetical protein CL656_00325 [bacterium]|nr:hypothetical protein [bacterium]|tara:strand:+ start:171 stop:1592 length:1422 start_codon:yes stop_codon:yes gene_type:complete
MNNSNRQAPQDNSRTESTEAQTQVNSEQLQTTATNEQKNQATALTQQYISENIETSDMTRHDLDVLNEDVFKEILTRLVGGGIAGQIATSMYDMFYEAEIIEDFNAPRHELTEEDHRVINESGDYSSSQSLNPALSLNSENTTPGQLMQNVETTGAGPAGLGHLKNSGRIRQSFPGIMMDGSGNERVINSNFARSILEGTPLTWERLQRICEASAFRYKPHQQLYYLPSALTIAKVLKERGYTGENFMFLFKLGLSVAYKETAAGGYGIYNPGDGAVGLTQFIRSTRESMFFQLPERERAQYTELNEAANNAKSMLKQRGRYYLDKQNNERRTGKYTNPDFLRYSNLLTGYMLHSPTLSTRLMLDLLLKNSRVVSRSGIAFGTPEHAKYCWFAYNVGAGRIAKAIEFDRRFPNPKQNEREARAWLEANGITKEGIQDRFIKKVGSYKTKRGKTAYKGRSVVENLFKELTSLLG